MITALLFLLCCITVSFCYRTHFVMVWDDFHYNATFPKNCFYYGTVPTGTNLATHYKSYLPLLQLFFYWGFQAAVFPFLFLFEVQESLAVSDSDEDDFRDFHRDLPWRLVRRAARTKG